MKRTLLLPAWIFLLVLSFVLGGCGRPGPDPNTANRHLQARQLFTEGLAYEGLSEYTSALDRYRKVIDRYPSDYDWVNRAHLRLARIYRNNLNESDQAVEHYRAFLESASGETTVTNVRMELARLFRDEASYDQAAELYERIIRSSPIDQSVQEGYYYLGEVYLDSENYEKSVETYNQSLERFPRGNLADGALFNMGKAYARLGSTTEAVSTYRRLLENYPDSGLREYTYLRVVRLAGEMNDLNLARNWAQAYLNEFQRGQYWSDIASVLEDQFEVDPGDLEAVPLSQNQEGGS